MARANVFVMKRANLQTEQRYIERIGELKNNGRGIHYVNKAMLRKIPLSEMDISLDNTGVITKDHELLDHCRREAFRRFCAGSYEIDGSIGERLGTVRGYNTGSPPVEAIMAVHKHARETGSSPRRIFQEILANGDGAEMIGALRERHLNKSERELALEMFAWYNDLYMHPDSARYIVEVPGARAVVMTLFKQCQDTGRRFSIITDGASNKKLFHKHFLAAGFSPEELVGLYNGNSMIITQEEVGQGFRKPHHKGLAMVKRGSVPLVYIGDTPRDGKTVMNAKGAGLDVAFFGVLSGGTRMEALMEYDPVIIARDISVFAEVFRN